MKQALLLILTIILFSFTTNSPEKNYTVTLPLEKWVSYSNGLEGIRQQLRLSDLPSRTVAYLTDSIITPLQNEIGVQVSQQIKKDSTGKK